MTQITRPGTLFLIPTNLTVPFSPAATLPAEVIQLVNRLDYFIAENAKTARQFLKTIGPLHPLQQITIGELNEHTPDHLLDELLAPLLSGKDAAVISEAGAPGVADPGAKLVALAHTHRVPVSPCIGPSSILLGLMASGLNGQHFSFHGYLPQERAARIRMIQKLEQESRKKKSTQLFIETPYRNTALLNDLLASLTSTTLLCLAVNLTAPDQWIRTQTVAEWKTICVELDKKPALFLLLSAAQ